MLGTASLLSVALATCALAAPAYPGDAADGEKVFKKCAPSHEVGETAKNRTGPVLNGVVGRPAGQIADFNYAEAMAASGLTWDEATRTQHLAMPKDLVKETKTAFAGLKDPGEIADVIAYLATFNPDGTRQ